MKKLERTRKVTFCPPLFCSRKREFATKSCPKRRVWPPYRDHFFFALPFGQKREAAAPWPRLQLSSARSGFHRYELRSRDSRPGLRWTYPIARAHDCAPGRRRPRPSHHLEVTRSFSANVCCACAYVQASRLGFPGDRLKYQWLIRLNRSATKTKSKFPACRVICSGMEQGGAAAAKLPLAASRLQQLDSLRLQQQVRSSAAGGGCGAVPGCHTATIASGCPTQSLYALTCRLLTCLCRKASHPSSITSSLVVGKLAQWYVRPRPPSASRMPSLTSPFPRHQPRTCTAALHSDTHLLPPYCAGCS